ncbi:MAG: hypothetical protein KBS99_01700 [Prevotellaceae bacterium]|nr:hypothetical protein [Candidatus Colivivens caballi]
MNNNWIVSQDKSKHKYVVGIDLGHGETSAAYAEIGWDQEMGTLEPVKDIDLPQDKTYVIPSAIAIENNGDVHIGSDAFEYPNAELHVCFKQQPISIDGKSEQLMIKFMKAVYELIRERMGAILTDTNHIVYIATPSGWDKATQELYGQMAANAGIPIGGVTWESRAAFIKAQSSADSGLPQYVDQGAIVFDMGSSTLDFTYISTDVIRDNQKPIDFGYNCGASMVEKIMYEQLREENDVVNDFEHKYPKATDRLLFEMRKGKEEYYRKAEHKLRKTVDFYQLVNDEDMDIIRCVYGPGELDNLLSSKGYVGKIRCAMQDYKENHINGKPIHAAFFTGGASRMDFLQDMVKELWGVDYVFRDQNPSLTISQGVAEAARSDIRSGGAGNIKSQIKKIMADIDVYDNFANLLGEKLESEITNSIAGPVISFKDSNEDLCLAVLQTSIEGYIKEDIGNIGAWAKECMEHAFDEATTEIREQMSKKMANYSKSDITMGKLSAKEIELPEFNLDIISDQIQSLANTFTESADGWTNVITGAAIGAVAAFIFTGPIGWIAGIGTFLWNTIFGENETEEEKREKARYKDLNAEERLKVYNEFSNNWDDISGKVHNAILNVLADSSIKQKVNSQCKAVLRKYAEDCLRQTRLMLD